MKTFEELMAPIPSDASPEYKAALVKEIKEYMEKNIEKMKENNKKIEKLNIAIEEREDFLLTIQPIIDTIKTEDMK